MARSIRLLASLGVLALLVGAGCKEKADDTAPQKGTDRSAGVQKALRRSLIRAERRPRDLQAQLEAGKLAYEQGLYNDAYRAYLRACNIDPQSLDAMVGMARTNLKLRNPTQGLDWVGRARRMKPDDVDLLGLEARLYLLSGQMDQAIAGFRRATEVQPGQVTTWLNLASAYAITRRYGLAVANARKAVTLAPNSAAPHFALGRFSEKNGDRATAEAEYRKAIRLDPQSAPAMVALARILADDGRSLDEARKLAVKASQIEADRADAPILAAWVLHLQGDDRRAGDELLKVVNAMPQNPDGWQKLAVIMRKLGRKEPAERAEAVAKQFLGQPRPEETELLDGRK